MSSNSSISESSISESGISPPISRKVNSPKQTSIKNNLFTRGRSKTNKTIADSKVSNSNTEISPPKKKSFFPSKKVNSPRQTSRKNNLLTRGRSKTNKTITETESNSKTEIFDKVIKIIDNTKLNITDNNIINPKSKFIVITYWWGRGNVNSNTQLPCKDLDHLKYNWYLKDGQKLKQNPINFEDMIENWKNTCIESECNFFSQEYPEFAKKGGYQLAINAKPLFIKKVLDTLVEIGRDDLAVLYIDGDMTINKYPHIFDITNVDFMCRGWNIDPRGGGDYQINPTFDPFTFETSGGIMYFNNNVYARNILNLWIKWSSLKKFEGKADDRILSMLVNSKKLYIDHNILQLPIEYLWLTGAYEPFDKNLQYLDKNDYKRKNILVEHPACLTSEETARDQGANASRQPAYYENLVDKFQNYQSEGGLIYEYIIFDNFNQANEFKTYFNYITNISYINEDGAQIIPYYVVNYKSFFGDKLTPYFIDNTDNIKNIITYIKTIDFSNYDNIIIELSNNFDRQSNPHKIHDYSFYIYKNKISLNDDKLITNFIVALLILNKNVIYIPKFAENLDLLNTINKKYKNYEFISCVDDDDIQYPSINNNNILFFNHNSNKLIKLLRISENIELFIKNFKKCILHVQLIRCLFILNYNKKHSNNRLSLSPYKKKILSFSDMEPFNSLDNNKSYKNISITTFKKYANIV